MIDRRTFLFVGALGLGALTAPVRVQAQPTDRFPDLVAEILRQMPKSSWS